jgi:hypothetical protein
MDEGRRMVWVTTNKVTQVYHKRSTCFQLTPTLSGYGSGNARMGLKRAKDLGLRPCKSCS